PLRCGGSSSRAPRGRELVISSASSGNWPSTSSEGKPLRMSQNPYPKWPVFRRSIVAAFQRSLTIEAIIGPKGLKSDEVTITKGYKNELQFVFSLDFAAIVGFHIDGADPALHQEEHDDLVKIENTSKLFEVLKS